MLGREQRKTDRVTVVAASFQLAGREHSDKLEACRYEKSEAQRAMATVFIPALLRDLAGGNDRLTARGNSVAAVIDDLESRFPGIKQRLCKGDRLAPGIVAAVDTQVAQLGLFQPVKEDSEVHFLPAIGGGQPTS